MKASWLVLAAVFVALHPMVRGEEPKTTLKFSAAGFQLELPLPWTRMPEMLEAQMKTLMRQKFIGTPLERFTFDAAVVRGADFQSILSGE